MLTGDLLQSYFMPNDVWDEMVNNQSIRDQYTKVVDFLGQLSIEELNKKEELAKRLFMSQGITFTVDGDDEDDQAADPDDAESQAGQRAAMDAVGGS